MKQNWMSTNSPTHIGYRFPREVQFREGNVNIQQTVLIKLDNHTQKSKLVSVLHSIYKISTYHRPKYKTKFYNFYKLTCEGIFVTMIYTDFF